MIVRDNFLGTGVLSPNWTQFGRLGRTLVRNADICNINNPSVAGDGFIGWTGHNFVNDHSVTVTMVGVADLMYLGVRANAAEPLNGYFIQFGFPFLDTVLFKYIAGTPTELQRVVGQGPTPGAGQTVSLSVTGNNILSFLGPNLVINFTDASIPTGGRPVILVSQTGATTVSFDDFQANGAIPPAGPPNTVSSSGMLSAGGTYTLVRNRTYQLPAKMVRISVQTDGSLETSQDGITWMAMGLSNNAENNIAMPFIRAIDVDAIITVKAMRRFLL